MDGTVVRRYNCEFGHLSEHHSIRGETLRHRRIGRAAALIPLALLATACGGLGTDWARQARDVADAPVGNTGAPNTGITADELMERVEKADRDVRGIRAEFHGNLYGTPISGFTRISSSGDQESEVLLKGKRVRELRVGSEEYVLMERGSFAVLFDALKASPGYDAEEDEPDGDFREFAKLIEGKYLKTKASPGSGAGLGTVDGMWGNGPFGKNDAGSGDDDDEGYYDDDYPAEAEYSLGQPTTVNGIETIPVKAVSDDGDGKKLTETLYIPAHGTPLPVRITSDEDGDGKDDASMDTRYTRDSGGTVVAPKDDDTVDMEKVMGGMFGFGGSDDDEDDTGRDPGSGAAA